MKSIADFNCAVGDGDSAERLQVILVYALGLVATLMIAWLRDPHALF